MTNTITLSKKTVEIVKMTAPVMAEHGYAITSTMYKTMLGENKDIAALFNPTHQKVLPGETKAQQPWSLAQAVHAYASHIDNLAVLGTAVNRIAEKHVSLNILPQHYDIVGTHLMAAVKEELQDAATEDICNAWLEAYQFLANIFIETEEKMRKSRAAAPGGWDGWRSFTVSDKVKESQDITSFYLVPTDGGELPTYQAGAYTAIRVRNGTMRTQRNYSLSSKPGEDFFRITVKRMPKTAEDGINACVSTWLHDEVQIGSKLELGVPCGDFLLMEKDLTDNKPLVFLSGGVGITPIMSMLESAISQGCKKDIAVITAAKTPEVEAWHNELNRYQQENPNVSFTSVYGRLTMDHIRTAIKNEDCHFYFCGPKAFMQSMYKGLRSWKVAEEQLHFEFFGPHTDLLL